jgi:hypothetical protein
MAITLIAEIHVPITENTNPGNATTVTLDKDEAAWSSVTAGDLVLAVIGFRGGSSPATISVTTTGGQVWTEEFDLATPGAGGYSLYSCIFDGNWTADPVFTNTGASDTPELWGVALRGVDSVTPWDVSPSASIDNADPKVIADYSTNTDGAWAFVGFGCLPNQNTATVDNSFVAPSGSGIVYWRSGAGAGITLGLARKEITSAGAVGATSFTLGAARDGIQWRGAVKPGVVGGPALPQDAMSGGFIA